MQSSNELDNYQTSEIVEKSSKSGIFSNKRLLVIKNGFLYYFTNVPKNYKQHVPDILNTFKQLPKSSIQIKEIQQIKIENNSNNNLIIKFYEKDMIQRQDIRKSITNNSYVHTKKNTSELKEWKFTFAKANNCQIWFSILQKLKAFFSKQAAKISEFFNNFDPVKRTSHIPPNNSDSSTDHFSQQNIISKFRQQDRQKQLQQQKQTSQKSPLNITSQPSTQSKNSQQINQGINQNQSLQKDKQYRQSIEQKIRIQQQRKSQKLIQGMNYQLQQKNRKIMELQKAIKQAQRLRNKQEQQRQKQRQKQRLLIKQKQKQFKKQLQAQKKKRQQTQRQRQQQRAQQKQKQRERQKQRLQQKQRERQRQKQIQKQKQQRQKQKQRQLKRKQQKQKQQQQKKYIQNQMLKQIHLLRQKQKQLQKQRQKSRQRHRQKQKLLEKQKQINQLSKLKLIDKQKQTQSKHQHKKQITTPKQKQNKLKEREKQSKKQKNLSTSRSRQRSVQNQKQQLQNKPQQRSKSIQKDTHKLQEKQQQVINQKQEQFKNQSSFTSHKTTSPSLCQSSIVRSLQQLQTEGEEENTINIPQKQDSKSKVKKIFYKNSNEYNFSSIISTQVQSLLDFKNPQLFSFQLSQKDRCYQNYDYYTQIQQIQNTQLNFDYRIKKQIKLINYVNKIKDLALDTFKQYIHLNHPIKTIVFNGTLFSIHVVWNPGKIINVNGSSKLVYSNLQHQLLKRQFKIYNELQDKFIQLIKKKKKFPLRVPLCYYFQYLGYSALLKYMPYLKPIQGEQQHSRVTNYLRKAVEQDKLSNYEYHLIGNKIAKIYMIIVKTPYKITKPAKNIQITPNQLYGPKFLQRTRNKFLQTNSKRLQQQIQKLSKQTNPQSQKIIMSLNQIILCRQLKNLFRSKQLFIHDQSNHQYQTHDFIQQFLKSPSETINLLNDHTQIQINGLLITYFRTFFGLKLPLDFNIYKINLSQIHFQYQPLFRTFSFNSLYPNKLLRNLQKYIYCEKYQIVQIAFHILAQIDQQNYTLQLHRIKYNIIKFSNNNNVDTQAIKNLIKKLKEIRDRTGKHNTIWLECYMLTIQCQNIIKDYQQCLKTINQTLEYMQYMLGSQGNSGQIQDYLYLLVAETLARMGNHEASMSIYTKLLQNPKSSLSQQQISLSIAQIYNNFKQVDSIALIQFLLPFLNQQHVTNLQSTSSVHLFWKSQINKLIAFLYQDIANLDLSVKHFEESLKYYQIKGITDEQSLNNVLKIQLGLLNNYHSKADKSIIFTKFITMMQLALQNDQLSIPTFKTIKSLFTTYFSSLIKTIDPQSLPTFTNFLQNFQFNSPNSHQSQINQITIDDLQQTLIKIINKNQLGNTQISILDFLDIPYILTCCGASH